MSKGSRPLEPQRAALALACAAAFAGPGLAQTTPPAVLPNVQQLAPPPQPPVTDTGQLPQRPAGAPRELARPADEPTLDVAGYAVEGGPPELQAELAAITAPYVGPGKGWEDLLRAANAVTVFLQTRLGLYLGYAYIPEQAPKDGRIRIAVLEGRLDRVVLNWRDDLPVRREVVEGYLAALVPGEPLRVRAVERAVFLVNDLRGLAARFEFREGREWGSAELVVTPAPEPRFAHRLDVDSDGSRFSGVERIGWQTALNSPLGRGDALTLAALATPGGGLAFALAGWTTPVGASGLKAGASVSAFRYRFDRDLLPQDVNGNATAASAYALYPWVRSRNLNVFALASLDHKRFADRQGVPDEVEVRKHSTELRLALAGDFRDDLASGGVSTYEVAFAGGRVAYDTNAPLFSDDKLRFAKVGFAFTRLQNVIDNRLLAYLNLRGQVARDNLDATQQFRLGGADGVRAYAAGEAPGDSGTLLSLELRWLPPPAVFGEIAREFVVSAFWDGGRVRPRQDASARPAGFVNRIRLAGAGVGIAWERSPNWNARVYLASATEGEARNDTAKRSPRVYALLSRKF